MATLPRSSKFRHVFAPPPKPEGSYINLKPNLNPWDSNNIKGSLRWFAFPWSVGGGGALAVLSYGDTGKKATQPPMLRGHSGAILDFDFCPFNDSVLATGSEDCNVKLWVIPEGMTESMEGSTATLEGHSKKVGTVDFNPVVNMLATTGFDLTLKVWDVAACQCSISLDASVLGVGKEVQSVSWSYDGARLALFSKDKAMRLVDPRAGPAALAAEVRDAHAGPKGGRVLWLGSSGRLFTTGFSRNAERQMALWDPAKLDQPLSMETIDQSAGMMMPFYDEDTSLLFLGGKGDGNMRYYELDGDALHFCADYKSSVPQRGLCLLPKRVCDSTKNEICRILKLTNNSVEPLMFSVPRRGDAFQEDLYPDCFNGEASLTSSEWLAGGSSRPKKAPFRQAGEATPRDSSAGFQTRLATPSPTPTPGIIPAPSPSAARPQSDSPTQSGKDSGRDVEELQGQLSRTQSQHASEVARLQAQHAAEIRRLQDELEQAKGKLKAAQRTEGELRVSLEAAEAEKKSLQERLHTAEREKAALVDRAERAAAAATALQAGSAAAAKASAASPGSERTAARSSGGRRDLEALRKLEAEQAERLQKREQENIAKLKQLKLDIAVKDAQIKQLVERLACAEIARENVN
eukprot:tig00001164_g7403.t1